MIVDATDLGMIAGLKRSVGEIRRGNKSVKICTLNLTLYRRTETDTHTEKSTDGGTTRSRKHTHTHTHTHTHITTTYDNNNGDLELLQECFLARKQVHKIHHRLNIAFACHLHAN